MDVDTRVDVVRFSLAAVGAVLGLFVIWLGPKFTNFYLHPVWQGALTCALVVGVLGMMGRLWSLVVVGVVPALLLALPALLSLEYRPGQHHLAGQQIHRPVMSAAKCWPTYQSRHWGRHCATTTCHQS